MDAHDYDMLRDTWIYRDIQQEIQAEVEQRYLSEQRALLLEIIQARFPRLVSLAQQVVRKLTEPEALRFLIVRISVAQRERDARRVLRERCVAR